MRYNQEFSLSTNDIKILDSLRKNPKGLLELQRDLGINYNHFRSRAKKLEDYKLIDIKKSGEGKKAIVDLTPLANEMLKLALLCSNPNLTSKKVEKLLSDKKD